MRKLQTLLCLIILFSCCKIFPQEIQKSLLEGNITYQRYLGVSIHGGVDRFWGNYYKEQIGIVGQGAITYWFPIYSYSHCLGLKTQFDYSNIKRSDDFGNYDILIDFNEHLIGLSYFFAFGYSGTSLGINALIGQLSWRSKNNQVIISKVSQSGIYKEYSSFQNQFVFHPSAEIKFYLSRAISFDIETSIIFPSDKSTISLFKDRLFQIKTGFTFNLFSTFDQDNDGIADGLDFCPNTPLLEINLVDNSGCSTSQKDSDHDGIPDDKDKYPRTPILVNSDGAALCELDTDLDGVPDDKDRCPNTPANERDKVDKFGCGPSQRDSDGDVVTDDKDKCPHTYWGEIVDSCGCSRRQIDLDDDGIPDSLDNCSNSAENYNYFQDEDGCPDTVDYKDFYKFEPDIEIFDTTDNQLRLNKKGKSSIKFEFGYILSDYKNTSWFLFVKSKINAKEKANLIKGVLDELSQDPARLNTRYDNTNNIDEIYLILNKEKAKRIALENISKRLMPKK